MSDTKAEDMVNPLREEFARRIRSAVAELPAHQALQLADTLCTVQLDVLAGLRVQYRQAPLLNGEAITESWRRGLQVKEIMTEHKCSRAAAYKYHPSKLDKRVGVG